MMEVELSADRPPERSGRLLAAVFRAAEHVAREGDLRAALAEIVQHVRQHLEVDRASVFLYDRRTGLLARLVAVDRAGYVQQEPGRPVRISEEGPVEPRWSWPMREVILGRVPFVHVTAHAIVPLLLHGKIIGALAVDNHYSGTPISERLLPSLRLFGHFAAVAITAALKQQELVQAEAQKKQFYRDIVYAVTNGKLILCEREEIDQRWPKGAAEHPVDQAHDIRGVRDAVQAVAQRAGMAPERTRDLSLCASEAATNALKHAGGGRVALDYDGEAVRVRVTDAGGGIDPLHLPRATLLKGYSTGASMGLGFTLMHELTDRLYLHTGPQGTTVILEMALHPMTEAEKMLARLNLAE